jgi:hypothetical protein
MPPPPSTRVDLSKLGDESKYTIDYLGDKNDNIRKLNSHYNHPLIRQ